MSLTDAPTPADPTAIAVEAPAKVRRPRGPNRSPFSGGAAPSRVANAQFVARYIGESTVGGRPAAQVILDEMIKTATSPANTPDEKKLKYLCQMAILDRWAGKPHQNLDPTLSKGYENADKMRALTDDQLRVLASLDPKGPAAANAPIDVGEPYTEAEPELGAIDDFTDVEL